MSTAGSPTRGGCPAPSPAASVAGMRMLRRVWTHLRVLGSARRNRADLARLLVRRPQWGLAVGVTETALLTMGRVDPELKVLATAKAAMVVECEFCLDIGSALARHEGIAEEKLTALPVYADSPVFTEIEKLVIGYAAALSTAPVVVPEEMRAELDRHFSLAQLTELAAEIAWENQRARFNQALGVRPAGFSDGAFCLMPEAR